jgi:hypothetical protein
MELQEFYEHLEQHRSNVVDTAVKRYHSLTSLMGKVRLRALYACLGALACTSIPAEPIVPATHQHLRSLGASWALTTHPCGHVANSQVEELVAGTNTGKSPQLTGYYTFWEQAVFNALIVMVLKGLDKLHSYMRSGQPLFKVSLGVHQVKVSTSTGSAVLC